MLGTWHKEDGAEECPCEEAAQCGDIGLHNCGLL